MSTSEPRNVLKLAHWTKWARSSSAEPNITNVEEWGRIWRKWWVSLQTGESSRREIAPYHRRRGTVDWDAKGEHQWLLQHCSKPWLVVVGSSDGWSAGRVFVRFGGRSLGREADDWAFTSQRNVSAQKMMSESAVPSGAFIWLYISVLLKLINCFYWFRVPKHTYSIDLQLDFHYKQPPLNVLFSPCFSSRF